MKALALFLLAVTTIAASAGMSVLISNEAIRRIDVAGTQRAQAQATFTGKYEATIEFPAVVRGRSINCVVVVNTDRRTQAIFC